MSGKRAASTSLSSRRKKPPNKRNNDAISQPETTEKGIPKTKPNKKVIVSPGSSAAPAPVEVSVRNETNIVEGSTTTQSIQAIPDVGPKSKYIAEKPAKVLPPAAANALKTKAITLFGAIKFFVSKDEVDNTPHIMDFVFSTVNWKGESLENQLRRCKHWEAAKNQVYQEINKLRANKITSFNHIVQGASRSCI